MQRETIKTITTMGQRTSTFVTYVDKNGKKTNNVYYNQWGIGRVQLNAIIGEFLLHCGSDRVFDLSHTPHMTNENLFVNTFYNNKINELDFTDISVIQNIVHQMDNNNGGVIFIFDEQNVEKKIGFVLGSEETYNTNEEAASRFTPLEEWVEKVGKPFTNDEYLKLVEGFIKHFKVEILK